VSRKAVLIVGSTQSGNGHARATAPITALEHVANRPILHHALEELDSAEFDGVIMAGEADALIDVRGSLGSRGSSLDRVEYAICRGGVDLVSVLTAVAGLVGDDVCLVQPADGLFEEPLARLLSQPSLDPADLVLFLGRPQGAAGVEDPSAVPGVPHRGGPDAGLFGPGALARAAERARSMGSPDMLSLANELSDEGANVRLAADSGWRRNRGHGRDLLELNRLALDRISGSVPVEVSRLNQVEGRVLVDPSAEVRASAIIGPTVIGPGAVVSDAYIGPYTAIGAGARVEGAEVERSIVSPGASVMHVGGRLVSSLVGRDARVFRDFSLPRALRLWVGDGDEIALC
jgi:glucose-1-phosphate thymidylyltransferase